MEVLCEYLDICGLDGIPLGSWNKVVWTVIAAIAQSGINRISPMEDVSGSNVARGAYAQEDALREIERRS